MTTTARVIEIDDTDAGVAPRVSPRVLETERTDAIVPTEPPRQLPAVVRRAPLRDRFLKIALGAIAVGFVGWLTIDAIDWVASAFARSTAFGVAALIAMTAGLGGAAAIIGREFTSLFRRKSVEAIHDRLAGNLDHIAAADARRAIADVLAVVPRDGEMKPALGAFQQQIQPHHSGPQQIELLSRTVLQPLDRRAEAHVRSAVLRAFGITAISPTALTDAVFFLAVGIRMVRSIAASYGHRPTTATTVHLLRRLVYEAGKLGAVDIASASVVQQLGGAVAERIASTTAEAMYASYRMARLGVMVMDLCRPVPFREDDVPSVSSLVGNVLKCRAETVSGTVQSP